MSTVAERMAAPVSGANVAELAAEGRREHRQLLGLAVPALVLVTFALFIPVGWLFYLSVIGEDGGLTLEHYERMLHPVYRKVLETTFTISGLVTVICIAMGYPGAYLMAQAGPKLRAVMLICVMLPFWTSLLVRTYAWLILLQRRGMVNDVLKDLGIIDIPLRLMHNFTGTTIGMAHIMLPFLVFPLFASMLAIDRDYMRAASNLGASPTRAFWEIYFPLTLPGLFAGVVLVFVLCLGFYVTPALLGGGRVIMWSMQIESNIALYANWGAASALGVVLLVVTLLILWGVNKLFRVDKVLGAG